MNASEIMTTAVVTVGPSDPVGSVVEKMLQHHVSALPVVDADGTVVGIVSEGDLLNRTETKTARTRSWWLELLAGPEDTARDFLRTHGTRASDIMSGTVITVTEDETAAEIARKLERHRIKRVPVVRDGKLVGIVSRANLLRTFASGTQATGDNASVRSAIEDLLEKAGILTHLVTVTVTDDTVELWGLVTTREQIVAARAAAESAAPGRTVENHLSVEPHQFGYL